MKKENVKKENYAEKFNKGMEFINKKLEKNKRKFKFQRRRRENRFD